MLPPRWIALLLALGMLTATQAGCSKLFAKFSPPDDDSADDDSAEDEGPSSVPVRATAARKGHLESTISSSSTVESVHQVTLITKVSGTVRSVNVEEGASVRKGQTLAVIDNPLQKGERDRARASLAKSEEDLERLRSLHDKGFISDNEWAETVHAHDLARTTFEQAQSSLDDTVIRAPFGGTVSLREIEVGENISVGKTVFAVVDLEQLEVEIHLPERNLADLAPGQAARINSEFTDLVTDGEVLRIAPTVDAATGTVKVTVAVKQDTPVLRPGMFVNVAVITATLDAAILIPKRAVVYEDGEPVAYVIREEKAVRVRLGKGQEQGDEREVSSGIDEGDPVIVMGQTALKDGALVSVVEK